MENGLTPNGKKIERFVRYHLRNERNDGSKCSHLILRHVTPNAQKGGSEIITIERPGKTTEDIITDIAQEIEATAENDATGLGSAQSYVIQAYYGSEKRPQGRCTLRVEGLSDTDEGEYSSEPASLAGALTQQMRHNEALTRALIMSQHQIVHTQRQMIESLHERNQHHERTHFELLTEREKLLDRRLERDLMIQEAEMKNESKRELMNGLKTWVPIALNKINGRKALPAADPVRLMIERLKESISPEQMAEVAKSLSPEQRAILFELVASCDETEENSPKELEQ